MTLDLSYWLRPGVIAYQAVMVTDAENLSDGSLWKIAASLLVFFALCWTAERNKDQWA